MQLQAVSIGHAVPRIDFDAVVHSVFDSVVNLQPNHEDRLLTVLASGDTDLPQGVRLQAPAGFSFNALTPHANVTCRGGVLRFDDLPLTIDLQKATCWDSQLPAVRADMTNQGVRTAWQCAWQALNDRQSLHGWGLIARELCDETAKQPVSWIEHARRSLHAIMEATRSSGSAPGKALRGLIGLGPGLTPSGDDLLAGYLIGLRCAIQGRSERELFLSRLASAVIRLSKRTDDISRTYVFHAAHGHASSPLMHIAEAICEGTPEPEILAGTAAAMQAGHTSGMDTVTGLLIGLAVWDARELLN